ncbi:MAG TPA: hypothetical protein VKR06_45980 [Ktedonosporobacter sp.]|nr:hypothetical protein [Ktedonosporobacter sp.]
MYYGRGIFTWLIYRIFGKRIGRIVTGSFLLAGGLFLLVLGIVGGTSTPGSYWLIVLLAFGVGALVLVMGLRTPPKNSAQKVSAPAGPYGQPQYPPQAPYAQQPQYPPQATPYGQQPQYPPQATPYGQQPQYPQYPPQQSAPNQPPYGH